MPSQWQPGIWWRTLFAVWLFLIYAQYAHAKLWERRELPRYSAAQIHALVSARDPSEAFDLKKPDSYLAKILIPRAPESSNHTLVREFITTTLKDLNWDVELDSFTDDTPYGKKSFHNIIATKDSDAPRRVVLAAHYDSKFFESYPANQFVGATDSAMPCALLLDVANALNPHLDARKTLSNSGLDLEEEEAAETTLQLIFFDGEEAFKEWTNTDSIYGARHLAEKWESEFVETPRFARSTTHLESINHLILLDLLGAPNPKIRSYFLSTAWMFDALIDIEHRLAELNVARTENSFFDVRNGPQHNSFGIGDDHVPFISRGVSILHIITSPFPSVWHTLGDDASALDMPTMKKWNLIFRVFMAEYLLLQIDGNDHKRDNGDLIL